MNIILHSGTLSLLLISKTKRFGLEIENNGSEKTFSDIDDYFHILLFTKNQISLLCFTLSTLSILVQTIITGGHNLIGDGFVQKQ